MLLHTKLYSQPVTLESCNFPKIGLNFLLILSDIIWLIVFEILAEINEMLMKTSCKIIFLRFYFKEPLHPAWGSNSEPQDQEAHTLLTEPARCLSFFLKTCKIIFNNSNTSTLDHLMYLFSSHGLQDSQNF